MGTWGGSCISQVTLVLTRSSSFEPSSFVIFLSNSLPAMGDLVSMKFLISSIKCPIKSGTNPGNVDNILEEFFVLAISRAVSRKKERQEGRKARQQENRKAGRQEGKKTERQEVRKSGRQEIRKAGSQEDRKAER